MEEILDNALMLKRDGYLAIIEGYKNGDIKQVFSKQLSLEEEATLRYWTTNKGYKEFNAELRSGKELPNEFSAQKNIMNRALNKLPKSSYNDPKILLYRIENLTEAEISQIYKAGETIELKGFISATYDLEAVAEAMARRPFNVLIRIEGKTSREIENLSSLKKEKELIFKSNTKFEVKSISISSSPLDMSPIKTIIIKEK